jgi:drug/metabolite transporter (DMT)-like permease
MRPKAYVMLFSLALIWGASYLFIKIGVQEMSPATLVALRLAGAVLTLCVICAVRPSLLSGWRRFLGLAVFVAIFNVVIPYLLISWGETRIYSGTASILNATTPLFALLLASVWIGNGREPLTWRKILGVIVGFVGVWVVLGLDPRALGNQSLSSVEGELAVVVAAASYGVGSLLSRRYAGAGPLVGPLTSLSVAFVISVPIALLWGKSTSIPSVKALAAVGTLGVVGTGIAYLFYFWLIRNVGATRTTLVTYLIPCTALIWGLAILGEPVGLNALGGLALVLLGTMITNGTIRLPAARRPSVAAAPAGEPLGSGTGHES